MAKRNCTIDDAVAAIDRHHLVAAAAAMVMCACGRWFRRTADFNAHQSSAVRADLQAYKTYKPITASLLEKVAAAYTAAAPRHRNAAVGQVVGCSTHSASFYVHAARKAGLLPPAGL